MIIFEVIIQNDLSDVLMDIITAMYIYDFCHSDDFVYVNTCLSYWNNLGTGCYLFLPGNILHDVCQLEDKDVFPLGRPVYQGGSPPCLFPE